MHGLMSYRHFGRPRSLRSDRTSARARSLRSDRADERSLLSDRASARARSLRSDRAEHAFARCVATLFELLSDDSRFLRKAFRKEESISKEYSSKKRNNYSFRVSVASDCNSALDYVSYEAMRPPLLYTYGRKRRGMDQKESVEGSDVSPAAS
ncbi:hypothetical protein DY000_02041507 [Brassica cretica]|uniref:Uncharacterized protein n=1 Tax=Brassica cretica TaxID=69181 RepID=A0ABQ7BD21_BRACR|nr:hypothetical protein DY000_02041507 [Brassica cretica]